MDRLACDRMFIAVFETGSFVGGSERLHTSAGQASKLVSRLETELDARLFNRTTRAVSPTEVGQAYYDRLRPLMDEYDALDDVDDGCECKTARTAQTNRTNDLWLPAIDPCPRRICAKVS